MYRCDVLDVLGHGFDHRGLCHVSLHVRGISETGSKLGIFDPSSVLQFRPEIRPGSELRRRTCEKLPSSDIGFHWGAWVQASTGRLYVLACKELVPNGLWTCNKGTAFFKFKEFEQICMPVTNKAL